MHVSVQHSFCKAVLLGCGQDVPRSSEGDWLKDERGFRGGYGACDTHTCRADSSLLPFWLFGRPLASWRP
jgi:hypothetical protein